ncbi:MAG: Stf0 family sulfotransferase [Ruegeria sp.]
MICTTPRSGSTLLCKMLAATGVAGMPDSHFYVPSFERWLTVYELDETTFASREAALQAIFEAALARGMANTDIFGLRMQRGSFGFFVEQLSLLSPDHTNDVERIESVLGPTTFIHLSRQDRVGQAISWLRAEQTGLWHRRADGSELERLAPPKEPRYDADAIARHVEELTSLDAEWEQWFEQEKLEPLRITYDALAAGPRKVLSGILSSIGCDHSLAEHVYPPTAKLADRESHDWRQRFIRERIHD